jgi:hypothetical protein
MELCVMSISMVFNTQEHHMIATGFAMFPYGPPDYSSWPVQARRLSECHRPHPLAEHLDSNCPSLLSLCPRPTRSHTLCRNTLPLPSCIPVRQLLCPNTLFSTSSPSLSLLLYVSIVPQHCESDLLARCRLRTQSPITDASPCSWR